MSNYRWWAAEGELTLRFQAALVVVPCRPRDFVKDCRKPREVVAQIVLIKIQSVVMALKRIAGRTEVVVRGKQSCLWVGRV